MTIRRRARAPAVGVFDMKEIWMKRRSVSLLLAILMLLPAALTLADSAPVTITSEDVRGKVGDTVTVTLEIAIEPPKVGETMDSLQFELVYDSSALEFVDIQEVSQDRVSILGVQYMCAVSSGKGAVGFAAAAADGVSGSGVLFHARFKVLSAVSTMLTLKKVAYSFVTKSGTTQDRRQGGTINLGRITGQSVPTTAAPATPVTAENTQAPGSDATDEPRYPVTEVTLAPGASPTAEPTPADNDLLAYIVFGLFIVVAILICVVLTLMIVRRGRRSRMQYFEENDDMAEAQDVPEERYDEEPYDQEPYDDEPPEEDDDQPPIEIIRRIKK